MIYAVLTLKQVAAMLCIAVITILIYKWGWIEKESSKSFSNLLLMVVNPALIFMALQKEYSRERLYGLLVVFFLSMLSFAVAIAVTRLFIRKGEEDQIGMERFGCVYSNCAFVGIPIIYAVFGQDGVFYLSAFLVAFNLMSWTHGLMQITGKKEIRQVMEFVKSPMFAALILGIFVYLFQLPVPEVAANVLNMISDMNTPLAMIVAGVAIADSDFRSMLLKKRIYLVSFVKLLFVPLLLLVLFRFIPADPIIKSVILVAMACPAATTGTMFAIRYHKNASYMAEIFSITTILSVFTVPVVIYLIQVWIVF